MHLKRICRLYAASLALAIIVASNAAAFAQDIVIIGTPPAGFTPPTGTINLGTTNSISPSTNTGSTTFLNAGSTPPSVGTGNATGNLAVLNTVNITNTVNLGNLNIGVTAGSDSIGNLNVIRGITAGAGNLGAGSIAGTANLGNLNAGGFGSSGGFQASVINISGGGVTIGGVTGGSIAPVTNINQGNSGNISIGATSIIAPIAPLLTPKTNNFSPAQQSTNSAARFAPSVVPNVNDSFPNFGVPTDRISWGFGVRANPPADAKAPPINASPTGRTLPNMVAIDETSYSIRHDGTAEFKENGSTLDFYKGFNPTDWSQANCCELRTCSHNHECRLNG